MANDKVDIPFRVFLHPKGRREYVLKIAKPSLPVQRQEDYPNVSRLTMSFDDNHGLHIMHNLNHRNIFSIKAVGKTKLQTGNKVSVFFEGDAEDLFVETNSFWSNKVLGKHNIIPSATFQNIVRDTVDGLHFLWRNRIYHGNLTWQALLCEKSTQTIKLYDFKSKGSSEEAQWEDWEALIGMLRYVATRAHGLIGTTEEVVFYEVSALIDVMVTLTRNEDILSLRGIVFEDVFFWTPRERTDFVMTTVKELLDDPKFIDMVKNSNICSARWDLYEPRLGALNLSFTALLKHCNEYRETLSKTVNKFNVERKIDCVKLVYASYTHRNQIKVEPAVDVILRAKFPELFVRLYQIAKSLNIPVGADHPKVADGADVAGTSKAMEK